MAARRKAQRGPHNQPAAVIRAERSGLQLEQNEDTANGSEHRHHPFHAIRNVLVEPRRGEISSAAEVNIKLV